MATDTQCAYFAGFFDGEGSCGLYDTGDLGKQPQFRVSLCNTDPRPLQTVKTLFGGAIRARLPHKGHLGKKINYEWYVYGKNSETFLIAIRQFTIIKSEQIDVFLTARKYLVGKGNRKAMHNTDRLIKAEQKLKALKKVSS